MLQPHVNPSPDIRRLLNEGYEAEIRGTHLLIHHVPYVTPERVVAFGTLVCDLTINGDNIGPPADHIVHFIGSMPCFPNGDPMNPLLHQTHTRALAEGIVVNFSFSNKPAGGYRDYHHKMTRYIEMLSDQATSLDGTVKSQTFRVIEAQPEESVFWYRDTNSSRAEIEPITAKLKSQKLAIIGLGGSGSYVLDAVAKTPVDEIHLYDGDDFVQHNAFRSPGAPTVELLRNPPKKVDYFAEIYSNMRRGITAHAEFLTPANVTGLAGVDFVFICVDDGPAKETLVNYLEEAGRSFIDVGMGVDVVDAKLIGTLRSTLSTPAQRDVLRKRVSFATGEDDAYATNIQVAELNMMNAALAVIRWKKLIGFYQDLIGEHNCNYAINVNSLTE